MGKGSVVLFIQEYFAELTTGFSKIEAGTRGIVEQEEFVNGLGEEYKKIYYIRLDNGSRIRVDSVHENVTFKLLPRTKAATVLYNPKDDPELDELMGEDADAAFGFKK